MRTGSDRSQITPATTIDQAKGGTCRSDIRTGRRANTVVTTQTLAISRPSTTRPRPSTPRAMASGSRFGAATGPPSMA